MRNRTFRQRSFALLIFAFVVGYVLLAGLDSTPYDDGYFFKRFARNFLNHGALSWNVADGPVYGITSQAFLMVAALLTWAAGDHYVLATKAALAVCLLSTGVLLVVKTSRLTRRPVDGAALALIALTSPLVLTTMHSGMETALALLLVTVALTFDRASRGVVAGPARAACLTWAVYLCRPDAALVPAVAYAVAHRRNRRSLAMYAIALAAMLAACLGAFYLYYGTALPLPFYAKTRGLSSHGVAALPFDLSGKLVHAATFVASAAPLVFIAYWPGARRALPFGAAAAVFVAYHLAATQEIMGYRARFYLPALVPLTLAAAAEWDALVDRTPAWRILLLLAGTAAVITRAFASGIVENGGSVFLDQVAEISYLTPLVMVAALALSNARPSWRSKRAGVGLAIGAAALPAAATLAAMPPRLGRPLSDAEYLDRSSAEVTTFRGLADVARCLPAVRQVYHSEIGVLGLVLPEARVVDLVGLMSKELVLSHPPFDEYCLRDRPEALFLPHRAYVGLNREIAESRCLRDYTRVVRVSSSPLYIRRDLAPSFLACARDIAPWQ